MTFLFPAAPRRPVLASLVPTSRHVILASLLLLSPACSTTRSELPRGTPEAVGLDRAKLQAIRGDLEELMHSGKIPGAVALVARHGKIAYLDAVGHRDRELAATTDLPQPGSLLETSTIFRICSMTKPVTSVAAMMLADEGKLSLDDPVSKYIPEFAGVKVAAGSDPQGNAPDLVPAERPVTVRHLITHTSGLTYGLSARQPVSKIYQELGVCDGLIETPMTTGDNAVKIAKAPLLFQPGTKWEYGLNTDVLGRVVEVASGKTLEGFLEERLFRPLGMTDTHFHLPESKRSRLAVAYRPGKDGGIERLPDGPIPEGNSVYDTTYPVNESHNFSGGAGLVSTASDYARFCQMLLSGGELEGRRYLKKETVEAMTRDQTEGLMKGIGNHGDGFGLGFGVVTEKAKDAGLGSPGTFSWGGFYFTYFWVDPRQDLIGVLLSQMHPWAQTEMWANFRKRVYGAIVDGPAPAAAAGRTTAAVREASAAR